jgi:cytochrome c
MIIRRGPKILLATVCIFVASVAVAIAAMDERQARGLAILSKNCARCHAVNSEEKSPHPQAPPFRDVVRRYPVEDLEESLAEGILSGHPDMPEFTFNADQIDAIIAYLNFLKARE